MSAVDDRKQIERAKACARVTVVREYIDAGQLGGARRCLVSYLGSDVVFKLESGGDLDTACRKGLEILADLAFKLFDD